MTQKLKGITSPQGGEREGNDFLWICLICYKHGKNDKNKFRKFFQSVWLFGSWFLSQVGSYRQQCFRVAYLVYCLPCCESFSHTFGLFKPSFVRALVCVCCYYSRSVVVIDVLPFICIPAVCGMLTYLSLPTCQPSCRRPFSASLPKAQTPSILRLFRLLHPRQSFQLTCPCSSPHCVHANPWLCRDECM